MSRTVILTGARGGQGTSTVATALAVLAAADGPTLLRSNDPAAAGALLGVPLPLGDEWIEVRPNLTFVPSSAPVTTLPAWDTVVIDAGRTPTGPFDTDLPLEDGNSGPGGAVERYAVLRGPCYVALCTLLSVDSRYGGAIVVAEQGRALGERDVADVLGIPVVATIPVDPAVARSIDAGLLLDRLHRHPSPFSALSRLARPRDRSTSSSKRTGTDLPLSLSDRSEERVGCRVWSRSGAVWPAWRRCDGRSGGVEYRPVVARCG